MLYLFSTKMALRKAMVGLAKENPHFEAVSELMRSIGNHLTNGGISEMDAKIKAQEGILESLERQSKSLAEVIRAQEEESDRLSDGVVKEAITLSNLGLSISEAEAKLESLVAQIGSAEFEGQLYKDAASDFKHTLVSQ